MLKCENLPRTNSTKSETQNIFVKFQQNEHTPGPLNAMKIVILVIACTGMVTNLIVVIVFLNDRKLRRKIPNICIINQVCISLNPFFNRKKQTSLMAARNQQVMYLYIVCGDRINNVPDKGNSRVFS